MINSLDEAIKHCEEVAEKYCEKVEEGLTADDFCDSCASEHRQLAEWLKELKTYREAWIPVSERLPEKNGNYLVTVEANDGTASIKFQMVDHYGPKWLHEGKHEKVIAWMPLPEPYKAESEE